MSTTSKIFKSVFKISKFPFKLRSSRIKWSLDYQSRGSLKRLAYIPQHQQKQTIFETAREHILNQTELDYHDHDPVNAMRIFINRMQDKRKRLPLSVSMFTFFDLNNDDVQVGLNIPCLSLSENCNKQRGRVEKKEEKFQQTLAKRKAAIATRYTFKGTLRTQGIAARKLGKFQEEKK